jgi:hypothetical protein
MDPTDKPWGDDYFLFSTSNVMPRFMRGIHGRAFGHALKARRSASGADCRQISL